MTRPPQPLCTIFDVPPTASSDEPLPEYRYPLHTRTPSVRLRFSNTCFSFSYCSFLSSIHSYFEPHSYKEVCTDPHWIDAMHIELIALDKNGTWELVQLFAGKNLIGCKWVYKVKNNSDGFLELYKARLVAKGFSQEYGVDYKEKFAPVAKMTTVRTLISVAAVRQWPLFQLDVKNAFLNGHLHKEVYMRPLPGLTHPPGYVSRLRRALYGLKQSPRAQYKRFQLAITQIGFCSSAHDSTLFLRTTSQGLVIILLYVDDMIITGSDSFAIDEVKKHLFLEFEMKDLGPLRYFPGIEIASSPDANWAGDINDRKSTSGFYVFLGDSLLSWKSKKQTVVARSTAEVEYRAMAHATAKIVWLRWLLSDLGITISSPTPLYCDNTSAIQITHNSVFHERTKHIEIDCHFIRQHLQLGTIDLPLPLPRLLISLLRLICPLIFIFSLANSWYSLGSHLEFEGVV